MKNSDKTRTTQTQAGSGFIACDQCALDDICKPTPLSGKQALSQILNSMERRKPLLAGESLYCQDEKMESLYAVTSGTIKLLSTLESGRTQVIGFRLPGELLGDEAFFSRKHCISAVAVTNASVCIIPINDIDSISKLIPSFQTSLLELISQQCYLLHKQFSAYIAHNNAEEKLAAFILNIKERSLEKNNSIPLEMSKGDIANFLGLRNETFSRILSVFKKNKIISIESKMLQILDIKALQTIISS
jgi:CRP/FNR family transcriptional regulator